MYHVAKDYGKGKTSYLLFCSPNTSNPLTVTDFRLEAPCHARHFYPSNHIKYQICQMPTAPSDRTELVYVSIFHVKMFLQYIKTKTCQTEFIAVYMCV